MSRVFDRLDQAFEAVSQVCIAVTIPAKGEAIWRDVCAGMGVYAEQAEADGETLTYYFQPNFELATAFIRVACMWGEVRLPETPRGRQLHGALSRDFLESWAARERLIVPCAA